MTSQRKPSFLTEQLVDHLLALAGPFAVDLVVGGHHRHGAGVDAGLEGG